MFDYATDWIQSSARRAETLSALCKKAQRRTLSSYFCQPEDAAVKQLQIHFTERSLALSLLTKPFKISIGQWCVVSLGCNQPQAIIVALLHKGPRSKSPFSQGVFFF